MTSTIKATDTATTPRGGKSNRYGRGRVSLKRFLSRNEQERKQANCHGKPRRFWSSVSAGSSNKHMSKQAQSHLNKADTAGNGGEQDLAPIGFSKPLQLAANQEKEDTTTECISESSRSSNASFAPSTEGILKITTQETSLQTSYGDVFTKQTKTRPSVQFTRVTIQYHKVILGDHPQVTSGAPIALGSWDSSTETSLSEYERQRDESGQREPWKDRSRLSAKTRESMLVEAGVPHQSIRQRINRIKIQKDLMLRARIMETQRAKHTMGPAII
mmetsp:Transcript_12806/g.28164  ORF Transcript_12806/g.28164 Transcript_12806/m.28164 type:complete len:273 (-) Transcript_12806:43-861(-)